MGFMCGGEYIQDSRELEPADDAGICYDPECSGFGFEGDTCDNCGRYIGRNEYASNGGLCNTCRNGIL